jgi:hypothetical protein
MRRVGKVAFWAAFGGVVLPMAGGIATAVLFGLPLYWEAIFIGVILTATSVSISAQTLMEIGALRTREGATILGAAVIDDVMGIIVLSFVEAFARAAGVAPISAAWRSSSSGWRRISRLTFPRRPVTGDATVEETVGPSHAARPDLFVAQCFDRIEPRGANRRKHASGDANRGRESQPHCKRPQR